MMLPMHTLALPCVLPASTPFTYTEGIAIRKIAGANTFTIEVKKAGTTSATLAFGGVGVTANTQFTVGFAYKGVQSASGVLGEEILFKLDLNDGNGPRYQSLFASYCQRAYESVRCLGCVY